MSYTNNGELFERYTDTPRWFQVFKDLHGGFIGLKFEEVTYTPEQLTRLAECKDISPANDGEVYDYVINGTMQMESKIFKSKMSSERLEALEQAMLDMLMGGIF